MSLLGQKVVGNWGAYLPYWSGVVEAVHTELQLNHAHGVDVRWENGSKTEMMSNNILEGLPEKIGIYYE